MAEDQFQLEGMPKPKRNKSKRKSTDGGGSTFIYLLYFERNKRYLGNGIGIKGPAMKWPTNRYSFDNLSYPEFLGSSYRSKPSRIKGDTRF